MTQLKSPETIEDELLAYPEDRKDTWNIYIAGYGVFEFVGTEYEAEQARIAKSKWERGIGVKYRLTNPNTLDKLQELKVWFFSTRGSCPAFVFTQINNYRRGKLK